MTANSSTKTVKMSISQGKEVLGDITIALNEEKAPLTVANFLNYVEQGFYNGTIFHRVIKGFMIQAGGMNPDMSEKDNKNSTITNEANNGLKNTLGSIAMARTPDPHSASSQFFINISNNDFLNHASETNSGWGYAVFGEVIDGMEVVEKIAQVETGNHGGHGDVPKESITITEATLLDS